MATVFNRPAMRPVSLCGEALSHATHVCAFFDSSQQEYACIAPFFAEGLAQGEQVISIRDADACAGHLQALRELIPAPLDGAIARNQLRVLAAEESYLGDGPFESDRMFNMVDGMLRDSRAGFARVRTCGDMSWALEHLSGMDELMTYEARVNELTLEHDCTMMCVYDIDRFSGQDVIDVLATHPVVIMGDRLYENPYYVQPRDFIEKLMRRGSSGASALGREARRADG